MFVKYIRSKLANPLIKPEAFPVGVIIMGYTFFETMLRISSAKFIHFFHP